MSNTIGQAIPTGQWQIDDTHSSATFKVRHLGLTDFVGSFKRIGAGLSVGEDGALSLTGHAEVASLSVEDEQQRAHLLSPEFFDADRHPRIEFTAGDVRVDGDAVTVDGRLRIKGSEHSVVVQGKASGPVEGFDSKRHMALELSTVVDRTDYGLGWQAQTADGTDVLGDEVSLDVRIELVEE